MGDAAGFMNAAGQPVTNLQSWGHAIDTLVAGRGVSRPAQGEGHLLADKFVLATPEATHCFAEWADGAFVSYAQYAEAADQVYPPAQLRGTLACLFKSRLASLLPLPRPSGRWWPP